MKIAILSILAIIIASSYGLDCYEGTCFAYPYEGRPPSYLPCENPENVITCDRTNLASRNRNRTSKGTGRADVFACYTARGMSSKWSMVSRGCVYLDEINPNKCNTYPEIIDDETVEIEECTCTTDKCNGGKYENSGQSSVRGAAFMIISVFALIVKIASK